MRIDLNPAPELLHESNRGSAANLATAESFSASNGPGGTDRAELSGAHARVQALVTQASQLPDVREARVQPLRLAIQRGRYLSRPEEVARAVFAHMFAGPPA
jgi:flagellar biosynthesis anti-sigma factor FlgM